MLGVSMIAASTLAAGTPAFAARTARPPAARSHVPALIGPHLSVLSVASRRALAVAKSKELFGAFCNSPSDCWAVGEIRGKNTTVNQVLHWTGKRWFGVKVPNQAGTAKGDNNELLAVRCTSAKDCWAIGDSQQPGGVAQLDQALHFDGRRWTVVRTPAPGGTSGGAFNVLADISCTSARNCWAVGDYGLTGTSMQLEVAFNQVLHWDGRQWMFMKTPNPGGNSAGFINELNSVRCTMPTSCWAAGTDGSIMNGPSLRNEILFSNGLKWTTVKVPNPAGSGKLHVNVLKALACTAKADCWAVGVAGNLSTTKSKKQFEHNEALHWNGQHWTVIATPNQDKGSDELRGVTCVAAQDCWAVGTAGLGPGLNEAMHWNGAKWSAVHAVNGGGTGKQTINILNSVRCTSHSNCWAVGAAESANDSEVNQILHWNGTKWTDS
jgi:hypothetical protein